MPTPTYIATRSASGGDCRVLSQAKTQSKPYPNLNHIILAKYPPCCSCYVRPCVADQAKAGEPARVDGAEVSKRRGEGGERRSERGESEAREVRGKAREVGGEARRP